MHLHKTLEALLCKVFPTTLKDIAQEQYLGLEEASISLFSQLVTLFKVRFITSIPTKKIFLDLQEVVQEEGESLQSYISRFNKVPGQIENLSHNEALATLKQKTRYEKLIDSLYLDSPKSFTKLMSRAQKFMRLEEAWRYIRKRFEH